MDLAGAQGLLGQVTGRTSACVIDWLKARTPEFREAITFVAIDPAAVYAKAITTPGLLPIAVLVVDHFHIVALANAAVTKVRRRVIWEQKGRRGRKLDPARANRRRLLTARERLTDKAFASMWNSLIDSEPTGQVISAWIAKEQLRGVLALARTGADRSTVNATLYAFYRWCARAEIEELTTLATTIETWWPAIAAFIDTGITNARTEGINRLIKQMKRSACGFRNVENSHRRIRLHATRKHRAATATSRGWDLELRWVRGACAARYDDVAVVTGRVLVRIAGCRIGTGDRVSIGGVVMVWSPAWRCGASGRRGNSGGALGSG